MSVGARSLPFLGQRETTDQCQIVESILSRALSRANDWMETFHSLTNLSFRKHVLFINFSPQ